MKFLELFSYSRAWSCYVFFFSGEGAGDGVERVVLWQAFASVTTIYIYKCEQPNMLIHVSWFPLAVFM